MPHSRTQKLTARTIVASFVILGVVILFVPSGALGSIFDLQQTGSPTGSPTRTASPTGSPTGGSPSPSPTGIQEIQFYNPSGGNSVVVSTKNDGTDTTYHLVAVARQVPANPLVEFKYQVGTGNEVSIGIASRVGTTDAFEFGWGVPSSLDGSVVLKAILYNGALELGRDQVTATVNNSDSLESPQAEALEITYPRNGANAGFFQPQGATTAFTVVNTTSSGPIGGTSTSRGTTSVQLRYTKTPPGQEPVWTNCGTATPSATFTTSSRCTLASGDTPAMVTGIAAQASQQISQLATGSGDAHRVFPYDQAPNAITLNPATQSGKAAGACADVITATVLDQNNQPLAGVNADVHAKGPSDALRFDDSGDNSSAHQAPDKAHTPTAGEQAWNCEGTGGGGAQGDHELSPGNPDIKHIETTGTGTQATTGTDNAGQFKFQLYSPDGPGSTEVVVFADTDDDDLWCAEETSGNGSIGWSANPSPSPTSTSTSSPTSSPSGSPTSSPTRTGSPTGSPTSGGGPTPTPEPTSLQPERQSCPRGTASPTGSPTPGPGNRSMSLEVSKGRVTAGARIEISGVVQSQNTACEDGVPVEISRRIHGTNQFRDFRTTATDAEGNYSVRTRVKKSADYQASVAEAGDCDAASSEAEPNLVRAKVSINASDETPSAGSTVEITGKVSPNHRGDNVVLQRRKGQKWVKVARDELNRRSRYAFELEVNWDRTRKFRVIWPKQAPTNLAGKSSAEAIRAT